MRGAQLSASAAVDTCAASPARAAFAPAAPPVLGETRQSRAVAVSPPLPPADSSLAESRAPEWPRVEQSAPRHARSRRRGRRPECLRAARGRLLQRARSGGRRTLSPVEPL